MNDILNHKILRNDRYFLRFLEENIQDFEKTKNEVSIIESDFSFLNFKNYNDLINYANTTLKTQWAYKIQKKEKTALSIV